MKDLLALLRLVRPHWVIYSVTVLTVALGTLCYLLLPPQLGALIDSLHKIGDGNGGALAGRAIYTIAALLAFNALVTLIHGLFVSLTAERIVNELRATFFANLVRRPLDNSKTKPLGEIASEFASDLSLIQDGVSAKLVDFLRQSLFTLGAFVALFLIDFRMTILALVGICVVASVILMFIRTATKSILAVQHYRSKVLGLLVECASNAYVIQAYDRVEFMNNRFAKRLQETFASVRRQVLLMASVSPVSLIVFSGIMAGVVIYGVAEVRRGHLSVQQLVSYFTYALMLVASVSQMSYLSGQLRQAGAMITKHRHMLMPSDQGAYGYSKADQSANHVSKLSGARRPLGFVAHNLTFSYSGADANALANISFCIPPGKVTAITGESGAGKSTIAGILCGLLRPQAGSIEVLQDEATTNATMARDSIAIVPQEPFLFTGTFFENITFGREWLTRIDVQRAAKAARIHDHIMECSGAYESEIEEGGKNLSRGQRQRLAIARALVGRPSLLVLDEATSSLDIVSERAIKLLINELRDKVTVVIIAHQGELLSYIDHLIILERGRLNYEGRPESINVPGELAGFLRFAINRSGE